MNTDPNESIQANLKHAANEDKKTANDVKMSAEDLTNRATADIKEKATAVTQQAKEAYGTARQEACEYLDCANESIRKNPLPSVAGAFAFGVAIGCLIMSGRSTPTFQDRYLREPLDDASGALGRLYGNLKFW